MTELADELAGIAMFAGLDRPLLERLGAASRPRRLVRGQLLCGEGEPSDQLYLVRKGRLRVFRGSAHGDELVLSIVGPGESIGELSVVDERPRSASVDALESAQVLAVPSVLARELLRENPAAAWRVALALAGRVRRLTDTSADLVLLDLPRRIAKLLLASADGANTVTFPMSQAGVAASLGVTRQSFNRSLAALSRRGWIAAAGGGAISILDGAALRRFSQS